MKQGHKNYKLAFLILPLVALVGVLTILSSKGNFHLLNTKGLIATQEYQLMVTFVMLMLIVAIPIIILAFTFAWKYREGNSKATYAPDLKHDVWTQLMWWAIPSVIVIILAAITWNSTHQLDPLKPLDSKVKPITIQVVALEWKWLFIYPEYDIATVNFIQFPEETPLNFELTADAPMNSFWIPQLGGQMYAMSGMTTKLHLIANETGDFAGSAAEINGRGFAGMKFTARASSLNDFNNWVNSTKQSTDTLDMHTYNELAKKSESNPAAFYRSVESNLYDKIIMKFMPPSAEEKTMLEMPGMQQY